MASRRKSNKKKISRRIKRKMNKKKISRRIKRKISMGNKRKKISRMRSNKRFIGGEFINAGAEGVLYSNPRPPCQGENLVDIPYGEIGKLFPNIYLSSAEAEWNARSILEGIMSLEDINKYFVLPIKKCELDKELLIQEPYNTTKWRQNKRGEYNNRIFKNTEEQIPEEWNTMVVYPLAEMDLLDVLLKGVTTHRFINIIISLKNILEALKILQDNNLFYGDLTIENILLDKNTLKIADIGNVQKIGLETNLKSIPEHYNSYLYPSTTALLSNFVRDTDGTYKAKQLSDVILSPELLLKLYNDGSKNYRNETVYFDKLNEGLTYRFLNMLSIPENKQQIFNEAQLKFVNDIKNKLIGQKFFNYINIKFLIDNLNKNPLPEPVINNKYITKINKIYEQFSNMEELKNDLLKRIDIYSIGIIILIIINTYITTNIHIYRQDLIIKLYNIIYLCCNQEAKCANINEIISKYDAIIHVYSQILEEESRRQESARQKEEEEIKAETTQKTERQETQKRQLESQQELTDKLQRISTP